MNKTIFRVTTALALPFLLLVGCNNPTVKEESTQKKVNAVTESKKNTAEEPKKETPSEETNGAKNQNETNSESSGTDDTSTPQQNENQTNSAEKETNTTAASQKAASNEVNYNTYGNARFGFLVQYPDSFTAGPESDNGDGRSFENGEAKITAFGSNALDEDALQTDYQNAISDAVGPIAYQRTGDNWFVVSFVNAKNDIVYQKTVNKNSTLSTVIIKYPPSQKAKYDPLVSHVESTFIAGEGEN